jgi:uncharacterized protein
MDKEDVIKAAVLYANAVSSKYKNVQFFLFGSYAKGNYGTDSDIDIAVIFDNFKSLADIQLDLMRLRRKIDSRIEPHPFRKNDFEPNNPLAYEVLKHGLEIKHN